MIAESVEFESNSRSRAQLGFFRNQASSGTSNPDLVRHVVGNVSRCIFNPVDVCGRDESDGVGNGWREGDVGCVTHL